MSTTLCQGKLAASQIALLRDQPNSITQTISAKLTFRLGATYDARMRIKKKLSSNTRLYLYGGFVFLPLMIAMLIYYSFRINLPALLDWAWNEPALRLDSRLDWLVYNAPDGLWAFALMSFLVLTCSDDSAIVRRTYYATGTILMVGLEALQGSLLPGTFDWMDLLAILFGACSAWFFLSRCLSR